MMLSLRKLIVKFWSNIGKSVKKQKSGWEDCRGEIKWGNMKELIILHFAAEIS